MVVGKEVKDSLNNIKANNYYNMNLTSLFPCTMQVQFLGLNNIKANDYCNVILQALSHVEGLRNYFLEEANYRDITRPPGDQSFLLGEM